MQIVAGKAATASPSRTRYLKSNPLGTAHFRHAVLTGKHNFDRLFEQGKFVPGSGMSILSHEIGTSDPTRFAICVSRKTGNAVRRNRLRRVTRESLDPYIPGLRTGYTAALFPRPGFAELSFDERGRAVAKLLRKAHLMEGTAGRRQERHTT